MNDEEFINPNIPKKKKNEPEFFPGHRGIYGLTNTKNKNER